MPPARLGGMRRPTEDAVGVGLSCTISYRIETIDRLFPWIDRVAGGSAPPRPVGPPKWALNIACPGPAGASAPATN